MNMLGFLIIAAAGASANISINLTLLLSIISVSVACMIAFIKIFSKKFNPSDKPGKENEYCSQKLKDLARIERDVENNSATNQKLKDIINEFKVTLAELQKDVQTSSKTIEEMKQDNRDLAQRLETLLSQLVTYVSD